MRRNRRVMNAIFLLSLVFTVGIFIVATVDVVAGLGWGFSGKDLGYNALALPLIGLIWLFGRLVQGGVSSYVRHTYGPEPADDR